MYRRKIHCSYPHVILYNFFPKISKKVEKIFFLIKKLALIKKHCILIPAREKKIKTN